MSSANPSNFAKQVADDWVNGPYYDDAERAMEIQWSSVIWPMIKDCRFNSVLDLAAGHGRNTERLRHIAGRVTAVDVNRTNIDFLKKRFADARADNVDFLHVDGMTMPSIADRSISLFYCFDAMVHFDSDVVRSYIREAARVLEKDGHGFIHYSNYDSNPTGSYREHPGWRNFMSRQLFEHWLTKEGLQVVTSKYVMHNIKFVEQGSPDCDCVTLFAKR